MNFNRWSKIFFVTGVSSCMALVSCVPPDAPKIPGPAESVTREEAISTAYVYTQVEWDAEMRHVMHGDDGSGITVHTPDVSLNHRGFANGWWEPGKPMQGMPYQWGGFDTPRTFLRSLERGEFAGDISTKTKRELGDSGTSKRACGIDCSGFISRCWRLERSYSTKELPSICRKLKSWIHLKPGDILLNDRHVLLFKAWSPSGDSMLIYEAGPYPVWQVKAAEIGQDKLVREGYAAWTYRGMRD
ncbi:MAG: hypothetical protein V4727_09990 [Verrucomicrobiota bacterium]